jgi:hypothetical protein
MDALCRDYVLFRVCKSSECDREHATQVTAPNINWKIQSSGFIGPNLLFAAHNFHWRPANSIENERCP